MGETFSEVLGCGHCGNRARMPIKNTLNQTKTVRDEEVRVSWEEGHIYEVLECPSCQELTLRRYHYHSELDNPEEDIRYSILYPVASARTLGLPDPIRRAHEAAWRVRAIDPNAYGVLLGRLMEMICDDRQAEGNSLNAKLENLASRGEIPKQIVDLMHGLRKLRNLAAHASLGELSARELPVLDDLARAMLEYVYGVPFLLGQAEHRYGALQKTSKKKKSK